MLYSILIYDTEAVVDAFSKEEMDRQIDKHRALQERLSAEGRLGPVVRLMPSTTATTIRSSGGAPVVLDGPFAETKEQLVGFYLVDCATLEEALEAANGLPHRGGSLEVRPVAWYRPAKA